MNTRKTVWSMLSLLMIVTLALTACQTPAAPPAPTQPPAPAQPAGGEITIGLLTDDSGPLAIYGPMLERGWELGLEYATNGTGMVAGKTIKTVIKDTASDPEKG